MTYLRLIPQSLVLRTKLVFELQLKRHQEFIHTALDSLVHAYLEAIMQDSSILSYLKTVSVVH